MALNDKSLILIRHAHRDTTKKELDNGISRLGLGQAERLAKKLIKGIEGRQPLLLSSPKKRCIETLQPLARLTQTKVLTDLSLLEKMNEESLSEFSKRIKNFLKNWLESKENLTLICSHGDWLPLAMDFLIHTRVDFKKGAWAEVMFIKEKPVIRFWSE